TAGHQHLPIGRISFVRRSGPEKKEIESEDLVAAVNPVGNVLRRRLIAFVVQHNRKGRTEAEVTAGNPDCGRTERVGKFELIAECLQPWPFGTAEPPRGGYGNIRVAEHLFQLFTLRFDPGIPPRAFAWNRFAHNLARKLSGKSSSGKILAGQSAGKLFRRENLGVAWDLFCDFWQMEELRKEFIRVLPVVNL